jgi:hypothetical protein
LEGGNIHRFGLDPPDISDHHAIVQLTNPLIFFGVMIELLSHSQDVLRSRLLSEHLDKSVDEWVQSRLWYFGYQPVVQASLAEQRMGAILDRVGFKQPVKA